MYDLSIYLPPLYDGVVEMDEILSADEDILSDAKLELDNARNDQFVQTTTVRGIGQFEDTLNIVADPEEEDLEYRRTRVLNRLLEKPPFTTKFLEERLKAMLGEGNYTFTLNPSTYELEVRIMIDTKFVLRDAQLFLLNIVPANIKIIADLAYRTNQELIGYTYNQLSSYTHHQLREEVL